mmetsp:Transcript_2808/g.6215  ORF Transcript_2808/g.6215 Transcript_2808/m.6215 type:complete len:420 (-) Transcript_2808:361-1620(-)
MDQPRPGRRARLDGVGLRQGLQGGALPGRPGRLPVRTGLQLPLPVRGGRRVVPRRGAGGPALGGGRRRDRPAPAVPEPVRRRPGLLPGQDALGGAERESQRGGRLVVDDGAHGRRAHPVAPPSGYNALADGESHAVAPGAVRVPDNGTPDEPAHGRPVWFADGLLPVAEQEDVQEEPDLRPRGVAGGGRGVPRGDVRSHRDARRTALLGPLAGDRPVEDGPADSGPDRVLLLPDEEAVHQEPLLPLRRDLRHRPLRPGDVPTDGRAGPRAADAADVAAHGQADPEARDGQADPQARHGEPHPEARYGEPDPEARDGEPDAQARNGEADRQARNGKPDRQADRQADLQARHGGARHRPADPRELGQAQRAAQRVGTADAVRGGALRVADRVRRSDAVRRTHRVADRRAQLIRRSYRGALR